MGSAGRHEDVSSIPLIIHFVPISGISGISMLRVKMIDFTFLPIPFQCVLLPVVSELPGIL